MLALSVTPVTKNAMQNAMRRLRHDDDRSR